MYKQQIILFGILSILFIQACSPPDSKKEASNLRKPFEEGLLQFEKGKYYRAQEEFEFVLRRGAYTEFADSAQFYLAESYFFNKEYVQAITEYDNLVRYKTYSPFVELSRFRICQAYEKKSPKYYLDQDYTVNAIERYQEFIEDFPESEHVEEANEAIKKLRNKQARKEYESGILYIKLEEYKAALTYFDDVVVTYFDTDYTDKARVKVIEMYIRLGMIDTAQDFLMDHHDRFKSGNLLVEAEKLIESATVEGKVEP
ncbi:MAG: outer membrane protein assembly factor BamD [Fidelibacterota bacterium]